MESIEFKKVLGIWGQSHICFYPWRYSHDPYQILVSEFMLHRTQANQVIPVFNEFVKTYPTLSSILPNERMNIRQLLFPLGLNWRIEGMVTALIELNTKYCEVPLRMEQLTSIKGIGQYIAGATICFALNKPVTLIDTNTVRVIGRFFGIELKGEARRRKNIKEAIWQSVDIESPRNFYYSIIDLAHEICVPKLPFCINCPLLYSNCIYGVQYKTHPEVT